MIPDNDLRSDAGSLKSRSQVFLTNSSSSVAVMDMLGLLLGSSASFCWINGVDRDALRLHRLDILHQVLAYNHNTEAIGIRRHCCYCFSSIEGPTRVTPYLKGGFTVRICFSKGTRSNCIIGQLKYFTSYPAARAYHYRHRRIQRS